MLGVKFDLKGHFRAQGDLYATFPLKLIYPLKGHDEIPRYYVINLNMGNDHTSGKNYWTAQIWLSIVIFDQI